MLTCALGGLGRVMAQTLAELGADLVLVDRPGSDFSGLLGDLARWLAQRAGGPVPLGLAAAVSVDSDRDRARLRL